MRAVDLRMAGRLRRRGWRVWAPVDRAGCPNEASMTCCAERGDCQMVPKVDPLGAQCQHCGVRGGHNIDGCPRE